jgi:hypothetical protein
MNYIGCAPSNEGITVNDQLVIMLKKVCVAYFELAFDNSPEDLK